MSHARAAQQVIAEQVLASPRRFLATFRGPEAKDALEALWIALGAQEAEPVPPDGVDVVDGGDVVLLVFPAPLRATEPYAMAILGAPRARVFALEKGTSPGPPAWIAEITAEQRVNFGPLPDASLDGFLARVRRL